MIKVCFLGGARYSQPLDITSEKKFRALKALGELSSSGSLKICVRAGLPSTPAFTCCRSCCCLSCAMSRCLSWGRFWPCG